MRTDKAARALALGTLFGMTATMVPMSALAWYLDRAAGQQHSHPLVTLAVLAAVLLLAALTYVGQPDGLWMTARATSRRRSRR